MGRVRGKEVTFLKRKPRKLKFAQEINYNLEILKKIQNDFVATVLPFKLSFLFVRMCSSF